MQGTFHWHPTARRGHTAGAGPSCWHCRPCSHPGHCSQTLPAPDGLCSPVRPAWDTVTLGQHCLPQRCTRPCPNPCPHPQTQQDPNPYPCPPPQSQQDPHHHPTPTTPSPSRTHITTPHPPAPDPAGPRSLSLPTTPRPSRTHAAGVGCWQRVHEGSQLSSSGVPGALLTGRIWPLGLSWGQTPTSPAPWTHIPTNPFVHRLHEE